MRPSVEQRLQALGRGLALIQRTRSKDDRRVMLGCLYKDLDALRAQVALDQPRTPSTRRTKKKEEGMTPNLLDIPTLETERLRLRSIHKSDLDDYAALNADPEVLRHLGCGAEPWPRERAARHLTFLAGHWQMWGSGSWVLQHKETGAFLGVVGYSEPEGWPGCELAWALARRFWGNGYATEGARAALDWGLTTLRRERIISLIAPTNTASIRVAERLGESLLGRIQHFGREMLCYGIDRES